MVNKPRLTARIVRGLRSVYSLAEVNQYAESDLYKGTTAGERKEIDDAIMWLDRLCRWHEKTHGETTA